MQVPITVILNKEDAELFHDDVKLLIQGEPPAMRPGDSLTVTYKFNCELGVSEKQVDALTRMFAKPSVNFSVGMTQLEQVTADLRRIHYKVKQFGNNRPGITLGL